MSIKPSKPLPFTSKSKEDARKLFDKEKHNFSRFRKDKYLSFLLSQKIPQEMKDDITYVVKKNMKLIHESTLYDFPVYLHSMENTKCTYYAFKLNLFVPIVTPLRNLGVMTNLVGMGFQDLYSYLFDTKQTKINPKVLFSFVVVYEESPLYTDFITVKEVDELKESKDPEVISRIDSFGFYKKSVSHACVKCYKDSPDGIHISCKCEIVLCKEDFIEYVGGCETCIKKNKLCKQHIIFHKEECAEKCCNPSCHGYQNALVTKNKFKKCSSCMRVCYCSAECQAAHWKHSHKRECKSFVKKVVKGKETTVPTEKKTDESEGDEVEKTKEDEIEKTKKGSDEEESKTKKDDDKEDKEREQTKRTSYDNVMDEVD